jgi:hypothetical protein
MDLTHKMAYNYLYQNGLKEIAHEEKTPLEKSAAPC